jgi:hypothetical protein
MADERTKKSYEDVSEYPIDPDLLEVLFDKQTECALCWSTTDGWPVGVMHRYVWHDGKFWITTMSHRKRVPALRKRPKSCVIVSGENVLPGWKDFTATAKTTAIVHDDNAAVKAWFYPALAKRMAPGDEAMAAAFVARLDTPGRVILECVVDKWITYDGAKLAAHVRGRWQPGEPWEHDARLD